MVQSAGRAGSMTMPRADFTPYYAEIMADIRAQIAAGRLKPGDRIPSTAALAEHYGRAPGTVRRAIEELIKEGTLRAHQGVGVFVAEKP